MPKISELSAATTIGPTDLLVIVQAGATKKAAVSLVTTYARTGTSAPTTAATNVGEFFIDTTAKKLYVATATGSSPASGDWTILN